MFKKLGWFVIIIFLIAITAVIFFAILSDATRYCPLSHKMNYDQFCEIVDQRGNKLLIHHFNRDTNKLELSIYDDGKMMWIEHPDGKVKNFKEAIKENVISFDPTDDQRLIVNGENFQIKAIEQ